jgi:hypothetical protein
MVCNAKNHRWNCDCGFGGSGQSSEHVRTSITPDFFAVPRIPRRYTSPNARCPICSQSVFFFELENGGRVYFDEIGPPWPKHPCTDSASALNHASWADTLSQPQPQPQHDREYSEWILLTEISVKQVNDDLLLLSAKMNGASLFLYVRSDALGEKSSSRTFLSECFIQTRLAAERYDLALLTPDLRPMLIVGCRSLQDMGGI